MATAVLILGESGTGKSTSLRNFEPGEVAIINVSGKPLPFRKKLAMVNTDDYKKIMDMLPAIVKKGIKSIVIDDSNYLMTNAYMRQADVKGYDKFTIMAQNHWNLVYSVEKMLPDDVIVYFMSHIDRDQNGNERAKTVGKMIDSAVTFEGMFTIVLKTKVKDGQYLFSTHNNGFDTVKSPLGMFEADEIPNDLKLVDGTIREYYKEDKAE